jgi:transcriptional regulator with XRE-family HTH domain
MSRKPSRLKIARTIAGYTQAELAEAAGLHPDYVWEVEVGRKRPGRLARRVLAEALGVRRELLFPELEAARETATV